MLTYQMSLMDALAYCKIVPEHLQLSTTVFGLNMTIFGLIVWFVERARTKTYQKPEETHPAVGA